MTGLQPANWCAIGLAGLLTVGCVAERYRPAAALPVQWAETNPCKSLEPARHVRPRYPETAQAEGQRGWVALKYHVAASGDVFNVRVVAASEPGIFDEVSVAALSSWRYEPQHYPVSNCTHVYVYTLEPGPAQPPVTEEGSFAAFEEIAVGR